VKDALQPISTGIVASIAGFATSFALVIAALKTVGATDAQAASGLLALCFTTGLLAIIMGLRLRIPLTFAWSTPGAAVLLTSATRDFAAAVGAFLVCAALILLCGLWPALGRLIVRIPKPVASAMLAGVLFPICLSPVLAVGDPATSLLAVPIVVVWLVLYRIASRWAVPAAMAVAIVVIVLYAGTGWLDPARVAPHVEFVVPVFDPLVIVSLGVPLFIVTMAGQNVPGVVVLTTYGYETPFRTALVGTSIGSAVGAFFGAHAINLAAITAAITVGPEAHPDKSRRWIASVTAGVVYLILGLGAALATALVSAAPAILIEAVAGLAVLGALITGITGALDDPRHRVAAILTFLVVVSGIAPFGIGSALWGLLVGGLVMLWLGWRRPEAAPPLPS
jgi:benzoate membrane transport protein